MTDKDDTGNEPVPAGGTEPTEPPEAPPAPQPTPEPVTPPSSPWASDLESKFEDEGVRANVDQFLRENVQPYVTKIEQDSVQHRDANKLWQDFTEDPVNTYVAITNELFGDELTQKVTGLIGGEDDDDDLDFDFDDTPQRDPATQEAVEYFQQQKREQAYQEELDRVKQANDGLEIEEEMFHPFVVAADGDFDVAVAGYKRFVEQAQERFGVQVPNPEQVPAPPVIGSADRSPSTPPTEEHYDSLDDAMDAFLNETKSPPPPVGTA